MRPNYLLIPLIVALIATIGSWFTDQGMEWYQTINLPSWTPPGSTIGMVWTGIFILSAIAILTVWNRTKRDKRFWVIISLLGLNGVLNLAWSFLFFYSGLIGVAFWEAVLLDISVIGLIVLIWPKYKWAALLFLPYALWGGFAAYLNYIIWTLN